MKYLSTLTAVTLAVCMSGTFCSCKGEKGTETETTAEAIVARNETVTATESASESKPETSSVTTTTTSAPESATTTTTTTKATSTTTVKQTTKANPTPTAEVKQTAARVTPMSNVVATTAETALETAMESVSAAQTVQSVRETQKPTPTVFVPVAVDDKQYVARVWSSDEEPFEVTADAKYCVADFSDSETSGDPLNHSYWAGGKYVLDYDLPYSYEFGDDDIVHFYDTEGNETFALAYQDYILICNCVAHEYGNAYYVPTYERSLVAEVIMNRYWNWDYDSIYSTVTANGAFSGSSSYAGLPYLTGTADDSVTSAVAMFFCNYSNPNYYNEGYFYFHGDGVWNHFRTTY